MYSRVNHIQIKEKRIDQEPKSGHTKYDRDSTVEAMKGQNCKTQSIPCIEWSPDYGCAIIFHSAQDQCSTNMKLNVSGLDKHEEEVHIGEKGYQFSSVANSYVNLHVGEKRMEEKEKFWNRFQSTLSIVSKRHGDQRSAAGGKQGHQRTPAFIHAILKQSLDNNTSSDEMQPLGGLTDVGLHTGGEKRDTCYALVRSVFQWFLDQASFCCYKQNYLNGKIL